MRLALQFTNSILLLSLIALTVSGLHTLVSSGTAWVMSVHRLSAWVVLALIPAKSVIIWRSLRRGLSPSWDRGGQPLLSTAMAGVVLLAISFGLAWIWRIGDWWVVLGQTVISWHWVLGLVLLPLLALHVVQRWPRPQAKLLTSRRSLLRLTGLAALGALGWRWMEATAQRRAHPDQLRSPATGSREMASFSGNRFPVTTNPGEAPRRLQPDSWMLRVDGAVGSPMTWDYASVLQLPPATWVATVDCTVGWFSTQRWQGIPLVDLVGAAVPTPGAAYVRLIGSTGYEKVFTLRQARGILLATHVGGEVLSHDHGFPLRAVVPARRGWFWVKWLVRIEVLTAVGQGPAAG